MAVAIIAIMGTIFALLEIALGPLTGLSKTQLGITAGASLHEIAHAVAAGDAFGAVGIATIMKLSRVLMLVFAAIIIAVWWDKNHSEMPADGKRKVSFPWFMLGFIGASIIGTFVPFIGAIAPNLVDFAYIVLGMAMAALGINVNFSAIAKKGQKAFLRASSRPCCSCASRRESRRCSSNRLPLCHAVVLRRALDFGQQNRTENQRETA